MNKIIFLIIVVSYIGYSNAHAVPMASMEPNNSRRFVFDYLIKPVPTAKGIDMLVRLSFKSDSVVSFSLPKDYYGVRNYDQYFVDFKGINGTQVTDGVEINSKKLFPDKYNEINLSYRLTLSVKEMNKYSYSPSIDSQHFHLTGSQLLLPIGNMDDLNTYKITYTDYPEKWNFYSSLSVDPIQFSFAATYKELINSGFGGGNQSNSIFKIHGKTVSIFVQGEYSISNNQIVNSVKKIVEYQRSWFNDFEQPFYTVSITNRPEHVAGFSVPNMFICYIMNEIDSLKLYKLLSHEMFHMWVPHKLKIKLDDGEEQLKYNWFYEGFTDYLSRKILVEAGIMPYDEFVQSLNNDIYLTENNISKNETYDELIERKKSKNFSSIQNKLSYHKGSLIALKWDKEIKEINSDLSLKDLILELITNCNNNHEIGYSKFVEIGNSFGLNIDHDFKGYILNGMTVKIYENSFAGYHLEKTSANYFDLGLKIIKDNNSNLILDGINETSNAYKAGLRNGMQYIHIKNDYEYSNAWVRDEPVTVTVKINDENKTFQFYPSGAVFKLVQFEKIK